MARDLTISDFNQPTFSEGNFRRFEHDLYVVLQNHPRETIIEPVNITPSTYLVSVRGAIRSYLSPACPWTSTLLPKSIFARVFSEFVIRIQSRHEIYIGPRAGRWVNPQSVRHSVASSVSLSDVIDGSDVELVRALAVVKSRDKISGQITFLNLSSELCDEIAENFPNLTLMPGDDDGLTNMF